MTLEDAHSFVREHGVVLASAKGPVPNLAAAIAGEPIRGSWWAHPKSHTIFAIFQAIEAAPDILVCRIVKGRITFVHRRLWPCLVRLADRFAPVHLAQIHQEHTQAGHHLNRTVAFPDWAPADVRREASGLAEAEAMAALGDWVPRIGPLPRLG
ncbi:MAG: hypothetical protein JWO72_2684 [Caulobacteraceae bacterium]|nr:hypothetical protein [Caulobacteraceae bacterium]